MGRARRGPKTTTALRVARRGSGPVVYRLATVGRLSANCKAPACSAVGQPDPRPPSRASLDVHKCSGAIRQNLPDPDRCRTSSTRWRCGLRGFRARDQTLMRDFRVGHARIAHIASPTKFPSLGLKSGARGALDANTPRQDAGALPLGARSLVQGSKEKSAFNNMAGDTNVVKAESLDGPRLAGPSRAESCVGRTLDTFRVRSLVQCGEGPAIAGRLRPGACVLGWTTPGGTRGVTLPQASPSRFWVRHERRLNLVRLGEPPCRTRCRSFVSVGLRKGG